MTYYLLLEGDSEKDVYFDSNVLGEESFGTFYSGQGLVALNNIVNQKPELLETIKILDEMKNIIKTNAEIAKKIRDKLGSLGWN